MSKPFFEVFPTLKVKDDISEVRTTVRENNSILG